MWDSSGDKPYLYHLENVAGILAGYGHEAQIIAYLHDVVEDTEVTLEEIEIAFGSKIAACVSLLSDEPGKNRKQRKIKTYAKMANVQAGEIQELGLIVKAADRLANLEECSLNSNHDLLRMYLKEHKLFRDAVFRETLCDDIWSRIEAIVDNA